MHLILQVSAHFFSLAILYNLFEIFKEIPTDQIVKHVHLLFFLLDYHIFDEFLTNGAAYILLRLRLLYLLLLCFDRIKIFLKLLFSDVVDVEYAVTNHFLLQALAEGNLPLSVLFNKLHRRLIWNWVDG